ncbi:MAG TPA: response regulator [Steroidobacteraceae bacterium]|nr:response regulator [Steroidobacteraceae bacterium]
MTAARRLIAVVDDEASVRCALARMLNASQFEVDVFASGREFLEAVQVRRPDCVVLDYHMPGLNGRDVQRQLTSAQIRIPVIVVTAHEQPALREQCLAAGAVAYLAKPLRRERLVSAIHDAMSLGPGPTQPR